MQLPVRLIVPAALLATAAHAQTFTPKAIVQFQQGGDKERATLSRMPGLADLIRGPFGLGAADLNGDGANEIVVLSLTCDDAGCPVVVLQNNQGRATPIFARKVAGRLAITNEKANGYFQLAAADKAGAIMKDGAGKQVVYAVGASPATANAAPPPAPAAPKAPAPVAPAAAPPPSAASATRLDGAFLPVCLLERCLNPRVETKSGIGTASAKIEAKVTTADATAWCAKWNAANKTCVTDQVAQGGTGGGAKFRSPTYVATANCTTGELKAVDGRSYKYAGTWADGPGAGRAKFRGSMGESPAGRFEQQGAAQVANGATSIYQLALEPNAGESLALQWELLCAGAPAPQ
ncbi:MAG TPA: hypothetical protein VHH11_11035 [Gammaproteobacteria bacterium]|jgi:hypothetical protein|nr:hypothetical protein [Gammaproteobacteria bacterium]